MHRYNNLDYIFDLDYIDGWDQYIYILNKNIEEKSWERYLTELPLRQKHITFEDYFNKIKKPIPSIIKKSRTKEELDDMVNKIIKKDKER